MKFRLAFLLAMLVLPTLFIITTCKNENVSNGIKMVAHRGAMLERPENTMPAFKKALEIGADIIELDLFTSRDGHLFILHDRTLDRTTNGQGLASERTLSELQELDAGSHFNSKYSGERIPSFKEVLTWAVQADAVLLLDLKERGLEFAENVAHEVKSAKAENHVVVGVRSPKQAMEFGTLLPDTRRLAFIGSPDYIEDFANTGVYIIRLWLRWLIEDPSYAEKVRMAGTKLMINGKHGDLEETQTILQFQPDWILVDDVAQLKLSLEKLNS